jgi:hypothetical protein
MSLFKRNKLSHDPRLDAAVCEWLNLQPYGVSFERLCEEFSCPPEGMELTVKSLLKKGEIIETSEGYMLSYAKMAVARIG